MLKNDMLLWVCLLFGVSVCSTEQLYSNNSNTDYSTFKEQFKTGERDVSKIVSASENVYGVYFEDLSRRRIARRFNASFNQNYDSLKVPELLSLKKELLLVEWVDFESGDYRWNLFCPEKSSSDEFETISVSKVFWGHLKKLATDLTKSAQIVGSLHQVENDIVLVSWFGLNGSYEYAFITHIGLEKDIDVFNVLRKEASTVEQIDHLKWYAQSAKFSELFLFLGQLPGSNSFKIDNRIRNVIKADSTVNPFGDPLGGPSGVRHGDGAAQRHR